VLFLIFRSSSNNAFSYHCELALGGGGARLIEDDGDGGVGRGGGGYDPYEEKGRNVRKRKGPI
jgi:hypothetical protein